MTPDETCMCSTMVCNRMFAAGGQRWMAQQFYRVRLARRMQSTRIRPPAGRHRHAHRVPPDRRLAAQSSTCQTVTTTGMRRARSNGFTANRMPCSSKRAAPTTRKVSLPLACRSAVKYVRRCRPGHTFTNHMFKAQMLSGIRTCRKAMIDAPRRLLPCFICGGQMMYY